MSAMAADAHKHVSPSGNPPESPTSRAATAKARADELQQRRSELARGMPSNPESLLLARQRADEAMNRARLAHAAAAAKHVEAGDAHRRAAAAHEEAAMRAGDNAGAAHQDAAARHRDLAHRHDEAAEADLSHAWPRPNP
jgi:hypothetical protein